MSADPRQSLKRDLVITAWEGKGVVGNHPELVEFVARHNLDVLLLGKLTLPLAKRFRLPNYVCHRDDRVGRTGGGTAIAVKASIRLHLVSLPQHQHLGCFAVELHGALRGLLVVSAYKTPQKELLSQDLYAVFGAHRRVVMAGDLNCKHADWGSRLANPNGQRLRRYADSARVTVIGPAQPTYYPNRANARLDVLDVAAVKCICCPVHISSMAELSSDHCTIGVHVARDQRRVIEWERFGPALSRRLPEEVPLHTTQHIDEATALFDTAVVSAMHVSARMKPRITPDYQRIPAEIGLLASERNRLQRRWQRTRYPAYRAAFNRTSGKLRRDMRTFRNRCWELAVSQIDGPAEDRNVWRIPSALTGKR